MRIHKTQPYTVISPRRALHQQNLSKAASHANREVRATRTESNSTAVYWRWKCFWELGRPAFASACLSADPEYTCPERIMTNKTRFPLYCDPRLELVFPTVSPLGYQAWCNDLFYSGMVTEGNPVYSVRCVSGPPSTCAPTPDCPGDLPRPQPSITAVAATTMAGTGLLASATPTAVVGTGATGAGMTIPLVTGLAVGLGVLGAGVVVGGALYAGYRWGRREAHQLSIDDRLARTSDRLRQGCRNGSESIE